MSTVPSSPQPAQNPGNTPILTVTWDTVIGARHVGYDPDSGPEVEPVSLGEMVVAGLVERLLVEIKRDSSTGYRGAVEAARDAASGATAAEATALVREALAGEIRQTNHYGEPKGEPTTLRDLIRADIAKYLNEKVPERGYGGDRRGGFRELLQHEVDEAMNKELRAAIREAREQVVVKVQEKAAQLIGEAVKEGMRR